MSAGLGGQLPDVGDAAAVDPDAVPDDPLPDQLLGQGPERAGNLALAALELRDDPLGDRGLDPVGLGAALLLARDRQRRGQLARSLGGDRFVDVGLIVGEGRERGGLLGRRGGDLLLRLAHDLDERLGGFEALSDDVLGRTDRAAGRVGDQPQRARRGLGLDHHDGDVAVFEHPAGDDHVEGRLLELRVSREARPTDP